MTADHRLTPEQPLSRLQKRGLLMWVLVAWSLANVVVVSLPCRTRAFEQVTVRQPGEMEMRDQAEGTTP